MKVVFPYFPTSSIRWQYFWNRPLALLRHLVRIDPWELTAETRNYIAHEIAIKNTPFCDDPSWGEQERRRSSPTFKLLALFVAERDARIAAENRTTRYRAELIAANKERTRLARELAGAVGGLQNRS